MERSCPENRPASLRSHRGGQRSWLHRKTGCSPPGRRRAAACAFRGRTGPRARARWLSRRKLDREARPIWSIPSPVCRDFFATASCSSRRTRRNSYHRGVTDGGPSISYPAPAPLRRPTVGRTITRLRLLIGCRGAASRSLGCYRYFAGNHGCKEDRRAQPKGVREGVGGRAARRRGGETETRGAARRAARQEALRDRRRRLARLHVPGRDPDDVRAQRRAGRRLRHERRAAWSWRARTPRQRAAPSRAPTAPPTSTR